jgi:alpha-L-fucosidase
MSDKTMEGGAVQLTEMDPAAMERFLGYRYGAFIHWNPATLIGKEISWSRHVSIPHDEYDNLYKSFNPTEFDAEEWVRALKDGGFRYLVFVPKHHDGFAMWNTQTTDYNIMNTPFGRDIVEEIADACRNLDLPLCMYYSVSDFYHPDCVDGSFAHGTSYGPPGYKLPVGQEPDYERYVTYMKAQLKELTENYGPFVGWWFDGGWQEQWTYEHGADLYNYMHELQPGVLMNNRVGSAYNGDVYLPTWFPVEDERRVGDYAVLEVDMPRFNRDLPWEYTRPANERSYSWTPGPWGNPNTWIDDLVKSACGDGNYILGVSAPPTGRMGPELADRFVLVNAWLERYGESVYGTRGGPYMRTNAYGSTCKNNKVFLHIFDPQITELTVPALPKKVVGASMLNGGAATVSQTESAVVVQLKQHNIHSPSTIVVLELDGSAEDILPINEIPVNQNVKVRSSNKNGAKNGLASDGSMATYWKADGHTESPWLIYDLGSEKSISRAVLFEGAFEGQHSNIHHIQIEVKEGGGWKTVKEGKRILEGGWAGNPDTPYDFDIWPLSIVHPELRFDPVTARHVRLKLVRVSGKPVIHQFELYER